jgi:alkylation response protein AidB-like acyl-CoA dehydrogenase
MDFGLPDHIPMLRDTLRRFVSEEMPRAKAAKWDKDNHFPRDVLNKLAELGLMGLTVSEEYGGLGRDILGTMITIEELSRRSLAADADHRRLDRGSAEQHRKLGPLRGRPGRQ